MTLIDSEAASAAGLARPSDTRNPRHAEAEAAHHPIAVYLRISSKDQKTDSQRQSILEWLARNGYDLDQISWYPDVELGRTMKRPTFDRLQADIFAGTVKTVVVSKVDRIARRLREVEETELPGQGTRRGDYPCERCARRCTGVTVPGRDDPASSSPNRVTMYVPLFGLRSISISALSSASSSR